jgi:hypothetical protein
LDRSDIFSTVFGSRYYYSNASYCDDAGNLYITGVTDTVGFRYSTTYINGPSYSEAFLSKYDSSGAWVFGTVVGGGGVGFGITEDRCGKIVLSGIAGSTLPILGGDPTLVNNEFVAAFDPDNGALQYSTRIPGMHIVGSYPLLCDNAGNIVATSLLSESNAQHFLTKDAIQDRIRGRDDGTITRFRLPLCQPFTCSLTSPDTIRVTKKRRQVSPSRFAITLEITNADPSQRMTLVGGTLVLPQSVFPDPPTQQLTLGGVSLAPSEHRQFQWIVGIDSTRPPAGVTTICFDASYRMQGQLTDCPLSISACSITIVVLAVDDIEPRLSCRASCIDTVHAAPDGLSYTGIPFPFAFTVRNDDAGPVRIDSVRLLLPKGMGAETVPAADERRLGAVLPPGGELPCAWSLTVHPRLLQRTVTIAAVAYDHFGVAVASCERIVLIEPVAGTQCHLTGPPAIRYNETTGTVEPDSFQIDLLLENMVDTSQIAASVFLDMARAPHLALSGDESAEQGPAVIAERFKRHFAWKLVAVPFATSAMDTLTVRYRMAVDGVPRQCEHAIPLERIRYRLACSLAVPDPPLERDTSYENNPFHIVCDIANSGQTSAPRGTAVLSCADDALVGVTAAAVSFPSIDSGNTEQRSWRVLLRSSRFERRGTCAVSLRDSSGVELARCDMVIDLPRISRDLRCETSAPDTLRYDIASDTYSPDHFTASLMLANALDTAQSVIEAEMDLSTTPHLALDAGEAAAKSLDSIPAHGSAGLDWRLTVAQRLDSAIMERIAVRFRHAGDTAWIRCERDVVIEGGKRIIAASCAAAGHDTLWADVAYEDVIPHPVQVQYTITNTGTVPLEACSAAILHPPALRLVNPADSIRDYGRIAPGASVAREWLLEVNQASAQAGDHLLSWVRSCSNLSGDTACMKRVTLALGSPRGIVLSPWLLRFQAERHAPLPAAQTVTLWTGGALAMPWQLQPFASWLDVQPLMGSKMQAVSVQPNTTDMQDGVYGAIIDMASAAMISPPRIDVIYEIGMISGTDATEVLPVGIVLEAPYPNPAQSAISVAFSIATAGGAQLALYDIYGRRVMLLAEGDFAPGRHTVRAELSALPAGVYVCVLNAGSGCAARRMLLRK